MAQPPLSERMLGRGVALPVRPDPTTRALPSVLGSAAVRQSIEIILQTRPGERLMRPDFGCGLRRYLMDPNTPATRELIRRDVVRALSTWEPRIALDAVRVEPSPDDPSLVIVSIEYSHRVNNSSQSAVYLFSVES